MKKDSRTLIISLAFICAFVFTSSMVDNLEYKNDHQTAFFRSQFESIKTQNVSTYKKLYLKKKEVRCLLEELNEPPSRRYIEDEIANYRTYKKTFFKNYKQSFLPLHVSVRVNDPVDWSCAELDSVKYNYTVLVNDGRDERINWPKSTEYEPKEGEYTICLGLLFCHDSQHSFVIGISTIVYNKQLRLFRKVKTPRIQFLK